MKRKHRLALARKRRKSGWNYNPDFPIEKCPGLNTGEIIPILDGCAFLMKPKWPNGKIVRDGRVSVIQPFVVESESNGWDNIVHALKEHLTKGSAWAHLNLHKRSVKVERIVTRRTGKQSHEIDVTLRVRRQRHRGAPPPIDHRAPAA